SVSCSHSPSRLVLLILFLFSFSFAAPAAAYIFTLSLHDALPICTDGFPAVLRLWPCVGWFRTPSVTINKPKKVRACAGGLYSSEDRKSTRLNSSHVKISYAVFCLKKKNKQMAVRTNISEWWIIAT